MVDWQFWKLTWASFRGKIRNFLRDEPKMTYVVIGLVVAVCALGALTEVFTVKQPTETPQQAQARQLAAEQAQLVERAKERESQLCSLVPVCRKYGEVRQECAVAGSFRNCVMVKMGNSDFSDCADDGTIADASSSETPDRLSCFFDELTR